jgi:hypothetical protein
MCSANHVQQLSLGTEGQSRSIARNDGLKFKLSEIGLFLFHLKFLSIVNRMKQTK